MDHSSPGAAQLRQMRLTVHLDEQQIPERIEWEASDSPEPGPKRCEALAISLWDSVELSTLRLDLWTRNMPVHHMNAFVVQTLMTLAASYERATGNGEMAEEMKRFGRQFAERVELPAPPEEAP